MGKKGEKREGGEEKKRKKKGEKEKAQDYKNIHK